MGLNFQNFCAAPWRSFYLSADRKVSPCCVNDNGVGNSTGNIYADINCRGLIEIRELFLSGKIPIGCKPCFQQEDLGLKSLRNLMNESLVNQSNSIEYYKESVIKDPKIEILDVRFSNKCNFRCQICGPSLSSTWAQHIGQKEYLLSTNFDMVSFKKDILPNLKEIKFLGGEPLLIDQVYQTMEILIEMKKTDIKIIIVTNGSVLKYKKWDVLEMTSHFKNLTFSISLDGVGRHAEFLRPGARWLRLEKNLKEFQKIECQKNIFHTIYALNIFHSPVFSNYIREHFSIPIKINVLHKPNFLGVTALSKRLKEKAIKTLLPQESLYSPIISLLKESLQDKTNRPGGQMARILHYLFSVNKDIKMEEIYSLFPEFKGDHAVESYNRFDTQKME